jgi:hypothetical protein
MSGDLIAPLVELGLILVSTAILSLAAFRALSFRGSMVGAAYRNRALITGALALLMVPFAWLLIPLADLFTLPSAYIITILSYFAAVAIVGFLVLDSTIAVARGLDFFHRDSLRWGSLRGPAWATMFILTFVLFVLGFLVGLGPFDGIIPIAWPLPLAYFGCVLIVSSRRSQDRTLRSYSKWIGLFAGALVVDFALPVDQVIPELVFTALAAYCFYRTSMSLSSIYRIDAALASGASPKDMASVSPKGIDA